MVTKRTALIASIVACGAIALVAGGVLVPAGASPKVHTVKGVVGGTFTSFSGNPAAVSSTTGLPSPKVGDLFGVTVSLPAIAKPGLTQSTVGALGGEDEKGECSGSFKNPTAPPGFFCVYPDLDNSVNLYEGKNLAGVIVSSDGVAYVDAEPVEDGRLGVEVFWNAAAPGPSTLYATYAYTPAS